MDYLVLSDGTVSVTGGDVRDLVLDGTVEHGGVEYTVSSIGDSAFLGSEVLTTVSITGVPTIGSWAFGMCPALESVELGEGVITVSERAFGYDDTLQSVSLSSTVILLYENPFIACTSISTFTVDPGNAVYGIVDGSLVDLTDGILVLCLSDNPVYTVPDIVSEIGPAAF